MSFTQVPSLRRRSHLCALTAVLFALCLAAAIFAGPASAVVTTVGGVQFGVQPETNEPPTFVEPLSYTSGPVVHSTAPYALYWDHRSGKYRGVWQELISGFLQNVGAKSGSTGNDFAVITQYRDTTGANAAYDMTFHGAYTDTDSYPASENCTEPAPCLTDGQVRAELTKYIVANGLPTGLNPSSGPTPVYYVFTPPGVTICLEGAGEHGHCSSQSSTHPLCSYHSFIPAGGGLPSTVLYAVLPWTAGNYGMIGGGTLSGTNCQDGSGEMEEPNQIGLGPEGEHSAGLADLIINDVSDEALSTATDPLFNGWHEVAEGKEVVDKCRNDFLGGELPEKPTGTVDPETKAGTAHNQAINGRNYYLNDVFNQAAVYAPYPGVPCINGVNVVPEFTAQNQIRSGDVATFNTTESDVSLGIAKYTWSFGDGTGTEANCENRVPTNGFEPGECTESSGTNITNPVASTQHVYQYGGKYTVTLSVVDDGGNTASVSHEVTVSGPTAPAASQAGSSTSGSSGSSSPAGTTAGSQTSGTGSVPGAGASPSSATPVVATAKVASHSLATALRSGLAVNYTVDRQVAGRFEVLLATSLAHRVGLHGPAATALAAGTPAQIVIAKAVLVTAKGGRGTYRIVFSKTTAARLRKLHHVTLILRMVVHSATSPVATTVLSTASLR